jgi:transposase
MLHAELNLSRRKVDVCLVSAEGELVDEWASPPDADGLRGLAARAAMQGGPVRGVIESMNGARFVHDRLEEHGWDVLDRRRDQGQGPGAVGLQDPQDRRQGCWHVSARDLVPEVWPADPSIRREHHAERYQHTSAAWDNAAPRSPRSTSPVV